MTRPVRKDHEPGLWRRHASWGVWAVGAGLLVYSLVPRSGQGIPGWQPANDSLRASLAAHAVSQPSSAPAHAAATPSAIPASVPAPTIGHSPAAASSAEAASDASRGTLDLNSATEAELDALPGIGPAKAKTIVLYRETHRGFGSVEELLQVKGIGPKLLDQIRSMVSVGERR